MPEEFDPLSLTPPASPQLVCRTSGDFTMASPLGSPVNDDFGFEGSQSFWLDDLKSLGQGHVQKLVDSWEQATQIPDDLEPLELKKENSGSRRIVPPLIEYWEAKEKEIVLVSCSGAPGHAQCSGSSLDLESKIHCFHCSHPTVQEKTREIENELMFKLDTPVQPTQPSHSSLPDSLLYTSLLPDDSFDREPRFVNPKQYHRILKRRQQRAKYLQNHIVVRQDKPYKHRSRHEHAQRRQRGQGGRFMKKQETTPVKEQPHPEFPDTLIDPFMSDVFSFGGLAA